MSPKQIYLIISILAIGTFGVAQAASTVITDTSITTTNLTVTGTCTGCGGGGEGSFTAYSTLLVNETLTGTAASFGVIYNQVSDAGTVVGQDTGGKISITKVDGTLVNVLNTPTSGVSKNGNAFQSQSIKGEYQAVLNSTGDVIMIYKNSALLTSIPVNIVSSYSSISDTTISISPSGEYISIYGLDASTTKARVQIWQGT